MKKQVQVTLNLEVDMEANTATIQKGEFTPVAESSFKAKVLSVMKSMLANAESEHKQYKDIVTKMPEDLHLELLKEKSQTKYWTLRDAVSVIELL